MQHPAYAMLSLGHLFLRHALGAAVLLLCITIVEVIDGIILHASLRVADFNFNCRCSLWLRFASGSSCEG